MRIKCKKETVIMAVVTIILTVLITIHLFTQNKHTNERKEIELELNSLVEALAADESGTPYSCIGSGTLDCHTYKVREALYH